jgi:hypothetical protein
MTGDLFHSDGSRKYLTQDERQAFLTAATQFPHTVRSFGAVLTYTVDGNQLCEIGPHLLATLKPPGVGGSTWSPAAAPGAGSSV